MNRNLWGSRTWTHRLYSTATRPRAGLSPVHAPIFPDAKPDVNIFRREAVIPKNPALLRRGAGSPATFLPAADKWFAGDAAPGAEKGLSWPPSLYLNDFEDWTFPYELVLSSELKRQALLGFRDWLLEGTDLSDQMLAGILQPVASELGDQRFFQLVAPLRLLHKALAFNASQAVPPIELYIAQSSLADLPPAMRGDLPTPELVLRAGKGDVYSSSVWLGTEPTYTPLHRDPNPNLFCQLCGSKVVRLMPPALGDRVHLDVLARLRRQGSSRVRSTEMMEGAEREVLHEAVWESDALPDEVCEAEVGPGDALYIPQGWWHSIRSSGSEGRLNASVNWWFR